MQTIFAKSKDLEKVKGESKNTRQYSIEYLNALILAIKAKENLTDEEIATRIGYNEGYISQSRSRKEVTNKFVDSLKREFKEAASNMVYVYNTSTKPGINPNPIDQKDTMIQTLQGTIQNLLTQVADLKEQLANEKKKRRD